MPKVPKRFAAANFILMLFLSIAVALAILKIAAQVLIPVVIAMLLSLVLVPIAAFLNRKLKIPNVLCTILVLLAFISVVLFVGTILISSTRSIVDQYPKYEQRFLSIYEHIAEMMELPFDEGLSLFTNLWMQEGVRSFIQDVAIMLSTKLFSLIKDFSMIVLFCFFFMSEFRYFNTKMEFAFADVMPNKIRSMITDITNQVIKYISVKFFISLLTGITVYLGCLCTGLSFPILWGFIAFVMNFIPTIGSIFSCLITIVFALLQFWPSLLPVVIISVVLIGANTLFGNIIEPKIQGENLGLSPFIIIVALSVWGWIWGFAGMVIAVPLMVVIKIICENVEFLKPVSILLGTAPAAVPDGMTISEAEAEASEAAAVTAAETTAETKTESTAQ
ncbi:MAG: AI-2E family transporter [Spirochaetaceae bacterium]|nr:AI-2E family transporter [Spirochaetaceae bacterium]